MLRIDEETNLGVALATDGNGRFCLLDPYAGAQLALAEAYRNVAVSGAQPVAITDCLNFGSPEDPAIMWQFSEAIRGLVDGCRALGTPVTGGNVSFYNQTGRRPDPAHPGRRRARGDRRRDPAYADGLPVGPATRSTCSARPDDELAGSAWADAIHDHLGGRPPTVDFDHEQRLADLLIRASRRGRAQQRARPVRRRSGPGPGGVLPAPWPRGGDRAAERRRTRS